VARGGIVVALVGLVVSACSGLVETSVTSRFADGVGDTAPAAPPTVYDVTRVVSTRTGSGATGQLAVEVTFNQGIALPPAGSGPDSLGIQLAFDIGFDTDQNSATGGSLNCGALGTTSGMDFFVIGDGQFAPLGNRLPNGNYRVVSATLVQTGEASIAVSSNVLTVTVPLSALGNDDGQTQLAVFAGNRNGGTLNTTDCAPDPTGAVITRESPGIRRR